uniref:Ubiquitin-like protease family profile domain-containing protein n=1 Tax=Ditylenchus dipsaci TaxID=166011 RepID=A0A915CVL1_9BILA
MNFESGSEKILSYDDIVLFGCDLQSLGKRHGWLTDNLINFAANFLKNSIVKDELKDKICVVYATLVEIIKYCDEREDNVELFKNIGLSPDNWAIFLLNDSQSRMCRMERLFLLFDSMESSIIDKEVYSFANKLSIYLNVDMDPMRSPPGIVPVQRCPKMSVSGDCGVFVIEYMQAILMALNKNIAANSFTDIDLSHIDDEFILSQRRKWYYLIMDLKKEQDESFHASISHGVSDLCSGLFLGQYFCENPFINSTDATCEKDNSMIIECTVANGIKCVGLDSKTGTFKKKIQNACTHSKDYNLNTALLFSVFFGWLGFDRFYLGYYAIGLLKMSTFGFFFLLYILDIVLISLQLLGPADGTSYHPATNYLSSYFKSNETSLLLYNCLDCL